MQEPFYGWSILYMFLGIYIFTRFKDIKKIIYRNKIQEYYYTNKKIFLKTLISLEIIGIILSMIGFGLSYMIEPLYLKIGSIFFLMYPIYFTLKTFAEGYSVYKNIKFDLILLLLIPMYFIKKDSFVSISFYTGMIIFLLYFIYIGIYFIKNNFHFKEKEKREEVKLYCKYKIKDIFYKKIDFSLILFLKIGLEMVLLMILYPLFSLEQSIFLKESIGYFLWYTLLIYPFVDLLKNKIDQIVLTEDKKKYAKIIGITSFVLIFISTMTSFFANDILFIFYHDSSMIFYISCFSFVFLFLISYFYDWNKEKNMRKRNLKHILYYCILKIIGSFIVTKYSYFIHLTSFEAYFIYEEIILGLLCYLELKKYGELTYIHYPVIRYKILKITLCSLIVYAALLNITHLYEESNVWLFRSIITILLIIFSIFIYFIISLKSHLLYSIFTKEEIKKISR